MNNELFAVRLRECLETEKVSKRALSIKTEITRRTILYLCAGKCYPRYDSLIKIADFFKLSADYMLGIDDNIYKEYCSEFPLDKIPEVFKARMIECLKSNKMTEYRLAKILGIDQGIISKWKKQKHLPETATVVEIARILNTTVDYLLGRKEILQ